MADLAPEIRVPRPPRRYREEPQARTKPARRKRKPPGPRLFTFYVILGLAALALLNFGVDRIQREFALHLTGPTLAQRTQPFIVPVRGVQVASLRDTWGEARAGGRTHQGIDIPATRGTPILAVADGNIARFDQNARAGTAIYQYDASRRYAFFYAHLDRRAERLVEGAAVKKGDVIGYVGSTGNAVGPHLHFELHRLTPGARRVAINPYPYLLDGQPPA